VTLNSTQKSDEMVAEEEAEESNDSISYIDPSDLLEQSNIDEDGEVEDDEDLGNELEPIVEINMTEDNEDEDSCNVPDLELFEPSVVIDIDKEEDYEDADTGPINKEDCDPTIETSVLKHKNPKFTCRKCGFIANSSGTLTRHVSVVHRYKMVM